MEHPSFWEEKFGKVVNNAVTCMEKAQTGTAAGIWEMPLVRDPSVTQHPALSLSRSFFIVSLFVARSTLHTTCF